MPLEIKCREQKEDAPKNRRPLPLRQRRPPLLKSLFTPSKEEPSKVCRSLTLHLCFKVVYLCWRKTEENKGNSVKKESLGVPSTFAKGTPTFALLVRPPQNLPQDLFKAVRHQVALAIVDVGRLRWGSVAVSVSVAVSGLGLRLSDLRLYDFR